MQGRRWGSICVENNEGPRRRAQHRHSTLWTEGVCYLWWESRFCFNTIKSPGTEGTKQLSGEGLMSGGSSGAKPPGPHPWRTCLHRLQSHLAPGPLPAVLSLKEIVPQRQDSFPGASEFLSSALEDSRGKGSNHQTCKGRVARLKYWTS